MDKALLVTSFGTTYRDTAEKTICAIENDLAEAFPDRRLYRAWTSGFIRKKLKNRDGIDIDSPEEALQRIERDGITDVLVQTTTMMNGVEFGNVKTSVIDAAENFSSLHVGRPLLSTEEDIEKMAEAVLEIVPDMANEEALVLMGHGSPEGPNQIYTALEDVFHKKEKYIFVATVEAEPDLDHVIDELKDSDICKVCLMPLMVVAGDHATKDMAGDGQDSWKNRLKAAGYEVSCILRGMGEFPEIRKLYVEHAEDALK